MILQRITTAPKTPITPAKPAAMAPVGLAASPPAAEPVTAEPAAATEDEALVAAAAPLVDELDADEPV